MVKKTIRWSGEVEGIHSVQNTQPGLGTKGCDKNAGISQDSSLFQGKFRLHQVQVQVMGNPIQTRATF